MKSITINNAEVAALAGLPLEKTYLEHDDDWTGIEVVRAADEIEIVEYQGHECDYSSVSIFSSDSYVFHAIEAAKKDAELFYKAQREWTRLKMENPENCKYKGRLQEVSYVFGEGRKEYEVKLALCDKRRKCSIFENKDGKHPVYASLSDDLSLTEKAAELEFKAFLLKMRGDENGMD